MIHSVVLAVHVLAACALVGLVLIQHGRGADAGAAFGAGSSGTIFGSRGPASFLTRATAFLAAAFFVTSLMLTYIGGESVERSSIVERIEPADQAPADEIETGPGDIPVLPNSLAEERGAGSFSQPVDVDVPIPPRTAGSPEQD